MSISILCNGKSKVLIHLKKAGVSGVVDEQGQTPERRPHHLRILFLPMVGDVCLTFKGAEGLAADEELNGANDREAEKIIIWKL